MSESESPGRAIANHIRATHREWYGIVDQETFRFANTDLSKSVFRRAQQCNAIERVDPGSREWRLTDAAQRRVKRYKAMSKEYAAGTVVCPHCGHHGFKNLRDGGYECSVCEQEFEEFVEVGDV